MVPDVPESLELKIKREQYLAKQALADNEDVSIQVSHLYTRGNQPILVYCWASVCDAVPALNQHWFNVPYFLGITFYNAKYSFRVFIHLILQMDEKCNLFGETSYVLSGLLVS